MTKIDSPQNTPDLMDISVIDINTQERVAALPADKTQAAPISKAISVLPSHVWSVFRCASIRRRFRGMDYGNKFFSPLSLN